MCLDRRRTGCPIDRDGAICSDKIARELKESTVTSGVHFATIPAVSECQIFALHQVPVKHKTKTFSNWPTTVGNNKNSSCSNRSSSSKGIKEAELKISSGEMMEICLNKAAHQQEQ